MNKLSSWTRGILTKYSFVQVAIGSEDSEPAEFWGLLLTSITACIWLEKSIHTHNAKNTPQPTRMAGCQMLYSDFYTSCWYLDILTSMLFTFFFFFSCNKKMALDSGLGRTFSGKDVCHGLSFPVVIDKSCCPRCSSVELMWVWAILVCRGDSRGFSPWLHLFLASPGPTGLLGITGAVICQRIQAEGQSLAPKPQRTH